jgi:hypothetical protein
LLGFGDGYVEIENVKQVGGGVVRWRRMSLSA